MKIKKLIFGKLLLVYVFWFAFLSCQDHPANLAEKQRELIFSVFLVLSQNHFLQKNFNQNFFNEVLTNYIKTTDKQKIFYLKSDVDLFKQLSTYPSVTGNPQSDIINLLPSLLKISYQSQEIFHKRSDQFQKFSEDYLSQEIDFTVKENYYFPSDKHGFAENEDELREVWRKYLKYLTLNQLLITSPRGEEGLTASVFSSNESDARANVLIRIQRVSQDLKTRKVDQYLEDYLNAVGAAYDQYTAYFSPVEKETFNIHMTGQLEGIGAQIKKVEDGLIQIMAIVPGGPTYKQKALSVGDKIMKIDDGNGNLLDVISLNINEALSFIRGKKGTIARLLVKRVAGDIEKVEIIRDRIILEESYARSTILDTQIPGSPTKKIGYLYLPSFYGDHQNPSAPNSSGDVKKQLLYFNSQGVDAMIFDLRNNGGGYLDDAVNISGYFIEKGPVVRIRGRDKEFAPREDNDPSIIFTKPMVVMINENSASASEIFSAAMQDYGRAVVVGDPQSFGKATVQTVLEYEKQPYFKAIADIAGSLKYTIQKYYRVTGKSTQTVGVVPDIILPVDRIKQELENNPYARDSLPNIPYKKWDRFTYNIDDLKKSSSSRVNKSVFFNNIKKRLEILEKRQNEEFVSLVYKDEKVKNDHFLNQLDKFDLNVTKDRIPYAIIDSKINLSDTQEKQEEIKNWNKSVLDDYYLEEGVMILTDIIR